MRDFPQNFVERDSKRGNWTVRRSRAGRVPLLQRVGFPDTLNPPYGLAAYGGFVLDWTFRPDGEGQARSSLLRWSRRDGDQRARLCSKRTPGSLVKGKRRFTAFAAYTPVPGIRRSGREIPRGSGQIQQTLLFGIARWLLRSVQPRSIPAGRIRPLSHIGCTLAAGLCRCPAPNPPLER